MSEKNIQLLNKNRRKKLSAYLIYTLVFALLSAFIILIFNSYGKSFIWWDDGMYQHVNSLAYYGQYLRQTFTDFFHGDFELKMFEPSMGYGSDIITTLNYYVFGDPFAFFSVFVPKAYTEILYGVLIFVRLYLCGVVFCYFLHSHKKINPFAVSAGALIYTFCGYMLFASCRHPYFLNPCIFFPLILVGIDKILDGKSPYLFIAATAVSAIFNVYFLYILCIGMFIYAIFAYISRYKKIEIKPLFKTVFKFIGYFLVALLIAGIIFYPSIRALLNSSRASAHYSLEAFYSPAYYQTFISSFIGWQEAGAWTRLSLTACGVLGVIFLFTQRKKNTFLKILFVIGTVFLLSPVFGYAFNGFSYVSNRWSWMFCAIVAYIVATVMEEAESFEKVNIYIPAFIGITVSILGTVLSEGNPMTAFVSFLLLVASLIILCVPKNVKAFRGAFFGMLVVGLFINAFGLYGDGKKGSPIDKLTIGQANKFYDKGSAEKILLSPNIPEKLLEKRADKDISRADIYNGRWGRYNTQIQEGVLATSFYYSLSNYRITDYFDTFYLNVPMEQKYSDGDGRLALDLAAGVKYFLSADDSYVPYGYDKLLGETEFENKSFKLYCNEDAPNIVYAHKYSIPQDVFDKQSPIRKQQMILQGIVCENSALPEKNVTEYFDEEKEFKVECGKGVSFDGSSFKVTSKKAKAKLVFDGNSNSSTYVEFSQIGFTPLTYKDVFTDVVWHSFTREEKQRQTNKYALNTTKDKLYILMNAGFGVKAVTCFNPHYNYYKGADDFCVNMGYSEKGYTEINLDFDIPGIYSFEDLRVVCIDDKEILEIAKPLSEGISDIKSGKNSFSCSIVSDCPKEVVFTVPYSEGWSAYVDGNKAEINQSDVMYISVPVSAGEHKVEIRYCNHYIKLGILMTCFGFLCIVFIAVWQILKKKGIKMSHFARSLHKKH